MDDNTQLTDAVEAVEQPALRTEEGRRLPPGTLRLYLNEVQPRPGRSPLFRSADPSRP